MADPRIVENPRPIPRITYAELREMAFHGRFGPARGIHSAGQGKRHFPEHPQHEPAGRARTFIVEHIESESELERPITGIAGRRNFTILTVLKRNMNASTTLCNALEILDRYHASVEHITLGLDSFALVVSSAALENTLYDVIADIQKTCRRTMCACRTASRSSPPWAGKMPRPAPAPPASSSRRSASTGLNIRTIAQGADELSIIVGVENCDFEKAIRVLYDGSPADGKEILL